MSSVWAIISLIISGSESARASANAPKAGNLTVLGSTNDGWITSSPPSENLDTHLLAELFAKIDDHSYTNIHSVLLVKNGRLVVEKYYSGRDSEGQDHAFGPETLHELHSVTKSINSLLIGIAIDDHLISNVNEKITTFFPEYSDIFADHAKVAICLKDLLSMTAGLSWDEWTYPYTDVRNDHVGMNNSPDPVRYVLAKPVVDSPGTKFNYNSGVAITLGEIIYKTSGLRADTFAARYLFGPLGITNYYWGKYPNGTVQTGGGLYLRPRDMAKIGQLLLNGGHWEGQRIVGEDWIRQSMVQHAPDRTYGYQWWLGRLPARDQSVFACGAQGRGGQFIIVLPEIQMVAVFTGWNDANGLAEQPYDMLRRYIMPAALADKIKSENSR